MFCFQENLRARTELFVSRIYLFNGLFLHQKVCAVLNHTETRTEAEKQTNSQSAIQANPPNEQTGNELEGRISPSRLAVAYAMLIQGFSAEPLALPLTSLIFFEVLFLNDNGTVCSFSCRLRSCFQIFHGAQICSFLLLHIRRGQVSTPTLLS